MRVALSYGMVTAIDQADVLVAKVLKPGVAE